MAIKHDVIFNNSLTQSQYDALATKDEGTLYFITDTKRLYKGLALHSVLSNVLDVTFSTSTNVLTVIDRDGKPTSIDFQNYFDEKLDKKPNGTDLLVESNDKINPAYLPDALLGQLRFCGTFNPSTGAIVTDLRPPTDKLAWKQGDYLISLGTGNKNPGETTNLGTFQVGDWALNTDGDWEIIPNTDAVQSVNGKTGAVVLTKSDVGLGNVDNVKQAAKTDFDTHVADAVKHITATERSTWNAKTSVIVNNTLTSTSTTEALSAYQGNVLNDKIDSFQIVWQ